MRISIFGLGYVGTVSAGCLASDGHSVIGVDPNKMKVDMINAGSSPIVEAEIGSLISYAVESGALRATTSVNEAVKHSDLSFVCVGTPSQPNGDLDLVYVRSVCREIGEALVEKNAFHVIVFRSTMLPGSMRSVVIPTLEECSGKKAGSHFGVCINPEFLREGTAVYDYRHPPKTVIGETDQQAGDILVSLYAKLSAPLIRTDIESAEMVKYTDNTWHALKVAFANEIGRLSKAIGVDGTRVMQIFCTDLKLNLSSYYLKPGFAFGGSCLPKDLRALTHKGKDLDLDLPVLNSILPSNECQIKHGINIITSKGRRRIGILGFAFKAGTDDLRESPVVEVIEHLLGKGYILRIYDKNVNIAALTGANQDYIMNRISHISSLMVPSVDDVLRFAEVIVIGNMAEEFSDVHAKLNEQQSLVDLVRVNRAGSTKQADGICW